ncbi:MAG: N-acetylneuraminate synthase family protein [Candidatus Latescibacteria bacterium]|nr:N-acetylneuraminate synthase family protein [Candidatus Latescibacterota bacterium]
MTKREIIIGGKTISDDSDCFIIAEIGHNHQGDIGQCKELFMAAKECGVDAVKLQKRDNKFLYTKQLFNKPYDNENSFGATYGEHREALEFNKEQYRELLQYAAELGLVFFATAFDEPSADMLAELDIPAYKIASGDLRSIQLLRHIATIGKPMIASTGGASIEDVKRAYHAIMPINPNLSFLQCTASYPVEFSKLDLNVITTYRKMFPELVIGLSDHDNGIAMAPVAYILGARIIEKHFTLNHTWKGTDHAFSLEPIGMKKMVRDLRRVKIALGDGQKKIYPEEMQPIVKMSKKIVAARDLPKDHVITTDDITFKSPGDGLYPHEADKVVGKRTACALKEEETISWVKLQ